MIGSQKTKMFSNFDLGFPAYFSVCQLFLSRVFPKAGHKNSERIAGEQEL
jgi:hypothetical protein